MSRVRNPRMPEHTSASPIRNLFKQKEETQAVQEAEQSVPEEAPAAASETKRQILPEKEQPTTPGEERQPTPEPQPPAPPPSFFDDDDTSAIYGEITDDTTPEPPEIEIPEKEIVYEDISSDRKSGKRFSKLKERFQKIVNALKQQPEAEEYDDESDEELTDEDIDNSGIDLDSAKSIYKVNKPVEAPQETADASTIEAIKAIMSQKSGEPKTGHEAAAETSEKPINKTEQEPETETAGKPEKPPVKVEVVKQTETKPATETAEKPEKPPVKVEVVKQTETKPAIETAEKPEKPPVKVEVVKQTETKPATETAEKPEKPPVKVEVVKQAETKPETETAEKPEKTPVKVEVVKQAETKPETETAEKPEKPPVKVEVVKQTETKPETETAEKPEKPSVKEEAVKQTETKPQSEEHSASDRTEKPEEQRGSLLYSAPKAPTVTLPTSSKRTDTPAQEQIENVMPPKNKKERMKRELPVYDIFAEFAKEQKQKQKQEKETVESTPPEQTTVHEPAAVSPTEEDAGTGETMVRELETPAVNSVSAEPKAAPEETIITEPAAPEENLVPSGEEYAQTLNPVEESIPATVYPTSASAVDVMSSDDRQSDVPEQSMYADQAAATAVPSPSYPEHPQTTDTLRIPTTDYPYLTENDGISPISLSFGDDTQSRNVSQMDSSVMPVAPDIPEPSVDTMRYPDEIVPPEEEARYRADDLPGGDGIRIIPWETTKKEETVPEPLPPVSEPVNAPDLSEGQIPAVTYHYSHAEPFVVMAGKFSKTLRSEYEAILKVRHQSDPSVRLPKAPEPPPVSVPKKKNVSKPAAVSPKTAPVPTAVPKQKQEPPVKSAPKPAAPQIPAAAPVIPVPQIPKTKYPSIDALLKETSASKPVETAAPKKEKPSRKKKAEVKAAAPKQEEPTAPKEKPVKKKEKTIKMPKQKKKSFDFRTLFNGEEEYDPDDIQNPEEVKPQLDDFNEEADAEAINTEITTTFQTVFARMLILTGTTVVSIVLSLVAQCSPLFRESIRNGWLWFAIISFLLFAVSVVVYRLPIVNGLMDLRRFKGNPDTAIAVAAIAVAIQSVVALFTPDLFLDGTYHLYVPLVLLGMLLNSLGKLVLVLRTHGNFSFLKKPFPKFAGKIYSDDKMAAEMVKDLPCRKPYIAYPKRSSFMSNFLQLSFYPDPSEKAASKIAPFTTILALVGCILFGIINQSFAGAVSTFALMACMSIPMICLLAINLPLRRLCKSVLRSGAMITSYETVRQFCDTNVIMVDSSQLYPRGSVTLSGIKTYKQSKLNDAILAGAAIMDTVNGNMGYVFDNIVQCSKDALPKVDNVRYEDGMGIVAWVRGQRVLIGNRAHLESHNIKPPEIEQEERHTKRGLDVTYITVGGDLIAMFILSYKTDRNISRELRHLEQNGVSIIVRTVDANVTKEKVAERFGLFHRSVSILNSSLGDVCYEEIATTAETSRAYLVTRGKLSSFAKAISGCIKLQTTATITKMMQFIAMAIGLALVILICFVSGFAKLGCLQMLLYIGCWTIITLIVSLLRK